MGSLITLGIYAAIALGAIGAVWGFVHEHDNGVRNDQIAKDTIVLNQVKKERDDSRVAETQREAETAACVASAKTQSDAVSDLDKRAKAAIDASRAAIAAARAKSAAAESAIAGLQAQAASAPVAGQSCEDTLRKVDAELRPVIKAQRGAK